MRSWLFVPGDSERKIQKARACGADILILDLEDSVAPAAKAAARQLAAEAIPLLARPVAVRINPLGSGLADDDLAAVMPARPDVVVLPKAESARDVAELSARLAVHEAECGIPDGATRVMAIATETAASLFGLGGYAAAGGQRLAGLAWGAEDLAAALGASRRRDATGRYTDTFRLARTLCLAGAVAASVDPIDTVFTNFRDEAGLAAECAEAAADGFLGKMAIHPAQVPVINAAFTPGAEAIAEAEAVRAAFAAAPGAGVVAVDGRMLDLPHLVQAERLLARAAALRP
jgi:citrate lyase subunit beta/citryl-CoA lyase